MIDCYNKNVVFPPISGARPVVVACCLLPACWACPGSSDSLATIRIPMQVYNFDTILLYRIIRNTIQKNKYNFNNMCISPLLTWCYAFLGLPSLPGFEICCCCY